LTLRYAALTLVSLLVLFVVVFFSSTRFMQHQIDITVDAEINEVHASMETGDTESLRRVVETSIKENGGFFYLLQDASGKILAGDLPALESVVGEREFLNFKPAPQSPRIDLRGRGEVTADGSYLFIGANAHGVRELRNSVVRSFVLGVAAAMLIVLIGGAALSLSVLRRIEAVSQTSRDIIGGDLQRRIALSGSHDEFDHLATSLNAMLDRIQVLMDGLRQVSNDIAHDLRTPLTRLRQRLELAQTRSPDAAVLHTMLGTTLIDIDAILQTFGALLRIAQVESGARKARFTQVDLSELLYTVAEVYQPAFEEKSQNFTASIATGLVVPGDRELLAQLFANLLENATRHCPDEATIELIALRNGDSIDIRISDNGPGIPAPMHEKVLQRFVRLDASRNTPGDGLGLSMVAAICALHDASLLMSDGLPGLSVTVSLPTIEIEQSQPRTH
jgi:signal transduction histidine kinase